MSSGPLIQDIMVLRDEEPSGVTQSRSIFDLEKGLYQNMDDTTMCLMVTIDGHTGDNRAAYYLFWKGCFPVVYNSSHRKQGWDWVKPWIKVRRIAPIFE